jgi:hypothetical protein
MLVLELVESPESKDPVAGDAVCTQRPADVRGEDG